MFNIPDWGNQIMGALDYIVPGVLVIVAILAAWGALRWGRRIIKAVREITLTPWGVLFFIILLVALLYIWFQIARPMIH